jgi:hypothetical protein
MKNTKAQHENPKKFVITACKKNKKYGHKKKLRKLLKLTIHPNLKH